MARELTKFESEMQKILLQERSQLLDSMKKREKNIEQSANDASSNEDGDVMSQLVETAKENSLRAYDLKRLKALENALGRISAGTYGKCMKCGKKISQERLRAIPWALLCINCKNETETKKARLDAINQNQRMAEIDNAIDDSERETDDEKDD